MRTQSPLLIPRHLTSYQERNAHVQRQARPTSLRTPFPVLASCASADSRTRIISLSSFCRYVCGNNNYSSNDAKKVLPWERVPRSWRQKISWLHKPAVLNSITNTQGLPSGSGGKESTCNAGDMGSIPGQEDPLEEEMATHSSVLDWKIPWTQEPGRL